MTDERGSRSGRVEASPATGTAMARQTLLAVFGQVQTCVFQLELLKRCDRDAARRLLPQLKLNTLMLRWLHRHLQGPLQAQRARQLTPLTYAISLTLRYALAESARLLGALNDDALSDEAYFAATLGIAGPCAHHYPVSLRVYGNDPVEAEIQFLHDVENFLKQVNFCHLLVAADDALGVLATLDTFLAATVGSGLVAPPELYDASHPCSVCFEELCVTANQGETVGRRLVACNCDHVTRQVRVKFEPEDVERHLPHVPGIPQEKLDTALAAVRRIETAYARARADEAATVAAGDGGSATSADSNVQGTASALLDAHHVFQPASRRLYAISELQFWMSSAKDDAVARTVDTFSKNLDALYRREKCFHMQVAAVELAVFGRPLVHFEKAYAPHITELDAIDNLMAGSCATAPDDQLSALIRACYDHHMSSELMQRLTQSDKQNEEALRRLLLLECDNGSAYGYASYPGSAAQTAAGLDEHPERRSAHASESWETLLRDAQESVTARRRQYAERLSQRSMDSLAKCVRGQRRELEKLLRVNVYGSSLPSTFIALHNSFCARKTFLSAAATAGKVVDNRGRAACFDAHRFMKAALLRRPIDRSLWPSLTHQFFDLVNGPLFDHSTHNFAQPPNTALYFSVENVGLLPHMKEELARFMLQAVDGDWATSDFQAFYCFKSPQTRGITFSQRRAWQYIRELVLALSVFTSVFHCGHVDLLRADRATQPLGPAEQPRANGLYLTYETACPLVAVLNGRPGTIDADSVVIYDRDVFSILYAVLQQLAPGAQIPDS